MGHSGVLLGGYFSLCSGSFPHPIQHAGYPKDNAYGGLCFPLVAIHCTGIGRGSYVVSYLQWDISSVIAEYYVNITDADKFVAF